jgi:hypothetical protein
MAIKKPIPLIKETLRRILRAGGDAIATEVDINISHDKNLVGPMRRS